MTDYHITCVRMVNPIVPRSHTSILKVGAASREYTIPEVITYLRAGHRFYTTNAQRQHPRYVEVCRCEANSDHIRSIPDRNTDNNLESQPECR